MGWFDNEQQDGKPAAPAPQSAPPRPVAQGATPTAESGSTLGRQIHIDGTIVCEEDLTILGRVEGTIRAKGTLVIAKEADVKAKIDGQRVMVHGKVSGNVEGAERVVLGQTAQLVGNIHTPTLEIIEGARFKGSVEMNVPKAAPTTKPTAAPTVAPKKEAASNVGKPATPVAETKAAETPAGAQKQAGP